MALAGPAQRDSNGPLGNATVHMAGKQNGWLSLIERMLFIAGVILLGVYVTARIHGAIMSHAALRSLEENRPADASNISQSENRMLPDDSSPAAGRPLWSAERIGAYPKSTIRRAGTPLAVLRIPSVQLEAPVLEGTDRITLNSGVGRIAGTALPGERGNIGIAGHRDGFFRALKDLNRGDTIQLVTSHGTDTYVVDKLLITLPSDASVLRASTQSELTLVTCYPFYFVGTAPQRFIVRASLQKATQSSAAPSR